MANIIPPLISSSPPPMGPEEDDDDDFGDFTVANDLTYDCDGQSLPTTPVHRKEDNYEISCQVNENSLNVKQLNTTVQNDLKDNTSQDSGLSVVTSDSGWSSEQNFYEDVCNDDKTKSRGDSELTDSIIFSESGFTNTVVNLNDTSLKHVQNEINSLSGKPESSSDTQVAEFPGDINIELIESDVNINDDFEDFNQFCESEDVNNETVLSETSVQTCDNYINSQLSTENHTVDYVLDINEPKSSHITEQNIECNKDLNTELDHIESVDDQVSKENSDLVNKVYSQSLNDSDDFDDFTSFSSGNEIIKTESNDNDFSHFQSMTDNNEHKDSLNENDDDDFNDFESVTPNIQLRSMSIEETDIRQEDNSFVPNFDNIHVSNITTIKSNKEEANNDDFNDFTDFSSAPANQITQTLSKTSEPEIVNLFLDKSRKHDLSLKIKMIVSNAFVIKNEPVEDIGDVIDHMKENKIWKYYADIDNSETLKYRWDSSQNKVIYLKALKIDPNNIGPCWNLAMPRFAANLSASPLEPLKPEPAPSSSITETTTTVSTITDNSTPEIPVAQFDWNDSGLTNPLDDSKQETIPPPKDIELNPIPDVLATNFTEIQQKIQNDNDSVSSLKFSEFEIDSINEANKQIPNETDDEFTDFHSSIPQNNSKQIEFGVMNVPKMNLKETYIDNIHNAIRIENPIPFSDLKISMKNESKAKEMEDKLMVSDFSSVSKSHITNSKSTPNFKFVESKVDTINDSEEDDFADFQSITIKNTDEKPNTSSNTVDDFSDFQSVTMTNTNLPNKTLVKQEPTPIKTVIPEVNQAVSLPLQPQILQPIKSDVNKVTQINWPDPGITEDELNRFEELSFDIAAAKKEALKTEVPQQEQAVTDEEGWSDFVSANHPKNNIRSIIELPKTLSISSIAPAHTDFPHIGNQKMQYNADLNKSTSTFDRNNFSDTSKSKAIPETLQVSSSKPFTVQQSYQASSKSTVPNIPQSKTDQCFNKHPLENMPTYPMYNLGKYTDLPSIKTKEEDDDWSDFISNQNINHSNSGKNQISKVNWNQPPKFTNWNAPSMVTPNIIANPVHFEQFHSYSSQINSMNRNSAAACITTAGNKNQTHTAIQKGRNNIQTISSLPDLEFMTPKSIIRSSKISKK